jgi:cyclic di-GMP phosphodiesterase
METVHSPSILLVDEDAHRRALVAVMLEADGDVVREAESAREARDMLAEDRQDMVLLQVGLADVDGVSLARQLKNDPETRHLPLILLSGLDDDECRLIARGLGVQALVGTPADTAALREQVHRLLGLRPPGEEDRIHFLRGPAAYAPDELRQSYLETLEVLNVAAGMKSAELEPHLRHVGVLAGVLADRLGMGSKYSQTIAKASTMHDIGQIGLPDEVLLKPGHLDPQEHALMKCHCRIGEKILRRGRSPYLRMAAEIALGHHEHWDGSGYPYGLRGESIPFSARIVAVCDVYDHLRSKRCYKAPMDHEDAVRTMYVGDERTRPEHFDHHVLMAFHDAADDLRDACAGAVEKEGAGAPVC